MIETVAGWDVSDAQPLSDDMMHFVTGLFPLCRSITGDGVRQTLRRIAAIVPLNVSEIPSGTKALDWTVPDEWNVRSGWIKDPNGDIVADFASSNLHVMSYSTPVHLKLDLDALKKHLYSLPDHPDWIPYRTSYYVRDWGFCVPHRVLEKLIPGEYEVQIDASLEPGALTYGEVFLPGDLDQEVLISAHVCHPSMCNDNLSGIAVATFLADQLKHRRLRYSYRFVFAPATIGAITWLSQNDEAVKKIRHGLVLSCLGDSAPLTYKQTRHGNAEIDEASRLVVMDPAVGGRVLPFSPYGYDERQYASPGFDLPVGGLMRSPNGTFPEYHTSADNLDFIRGEQLVDSLDACIRIIGIIEENRTLINLSPYGEPQLGRRGLYRTKGGPDIEALSLAMLWVLNQSDGTNSLLDIALKSGQPFGFIVESANKLEEVGLLEPARGRTLP